MPKLTIGDLDDPRIADFHNLKDATLARDRGRFIVEGAGTLRVLLSRSSHRPESILLSERAHASMRDELAALDPSCPIFVAAQAVLDRIVGFPIHRGVLASCVRNEAVDPLALANSVLKEFERPRIVVLEGLTNLDNVGLVFRNAMALGARAVLLCPKTCDPLYRKAIRTSMGGTLCVPFARTDDLPRLLSELRRSDWQILAFDPASDAVDLGSLDASRLGPTALLFGTEGPGLSESALAASHRRVRIGMEPGVDSLNVAVAAGIALSSLRSNDSEKGDVR